MYMGVYPAWGTLKCATNGETRIGDAVDQLAEKLGLSANDRAPAGDLQRGVDVLCAGFGFVHSITCMPCRVFEGGVPRRAHQCCSGPGFGSAK